MEIHDLADYKSRKSKPITDFPKFKSYVQAKDGPATKTTTAQMQNLPTFDSGEDCE
jgi:hypothetical protein